MYPPCPAGKTMQVDRGQLPMPYPDLSLLYSCAVSRTSDSHGCHVPGPPQRQGTHESSAAHQGVRQAAGAYAERAPQQCRMHS